MLAMLTLRDMVMPDQKTKSGKRSFGSVMKYTALLLWRTTLTLAIVAGAAFAVQYGSAELTRRAEAAPSPDPAPIIPVSATPLTREAGYAVQRSFIGQVEPQKTVQMSFELSGRLDMVFVDEGDDITAGQLLAEQDTALLEVEKTQLLALKTATEAQLRFARQTYERIEALTTRGHTSQAGLDEAIAREDELRARVAEIEARLANVDVRIEKAQIFAPFEGRVTERLVDGGESLNPGQRVLSLVQLDAPHVRIGVPLDFSVDTLRDAQIEIEDRVYPAELVTLRPDIDPITRTRTAIFAVNADAALSFGQTARLLVAEQVAADGFWVPTVSLKEGARGQWTVLTVDPGSTVRAMSVEVLHAGSDRVFVRGPLVDGTFLIDEGPQRVTVGQTVTVQSQIAG